MSFLPVPINISNITNAALGVVTTSSNHGLTTGQTVRLLVPNGFGMVQLDKKLAQVSVIDATSFSIYKSFVRNEPWDTSSFYPFTTPVGYQRQYAAIVPVGVQPTLSPVGVWENTLIDQVYNNSTVAIPF